jgi:hypothetical protein
MTIPSGCGRIVSTFTFCRKGSAWFLACCEAHVESAAQESRVTKPPANSPASWSGGRLGTEETTMSGWLPPGVTDKDIDAARAAIAKAKGELQPEERKEYAAK